MMGFQELLDELTLQLDANAVSLQDASQRMSRFIQEQLGCSRVCVWLLEGSAQGPVMRRLAGFDAGVGTSLTEIKTLCGMDFAGYFKGATNNGVFISPDTLADTRLTSMRDSYLIPNDIRATLYATIGANGSTSALLCCSQHGGPRQWSTHDVRALKLYADAISLRRARRRQREAAAASLGERLLSPLSLFSGQ